MKVIGRIDRVDLPDFGLYDIDAKIDTGAYGCALHCHQINRVQKDGAEVLAFSVLDPDHPEYGETVYYAKEFTYKAIKSSSGEIEDRFAIVTEMVIFGKSRKLEFSLTDRSSMKYPILLGRKFLAKKYIVDVQQKDVSYTQKINK